MIQVRAARLVAVVQDVERELTGDGFGDLLLTHLPLEVLGRDPPVVCYGDDRVIELIRGDAEPRRRDDGQQYLDGLHI